MVSLGQFSYDLTIGNQAALQALKAVETQASQTYAALKAGGNMTVNAQSATQAVSALSKAAQTTAAEIAKPITVQVNTQGAQSQLQKFGQSVASGLGFGTGAAIAVKGIDAITGALTDSIGAGLQYNMQLETATKTLELFTGSAGGAQDALKTLRQYADFTPFDTDEVIQGGQAFIKAVDGDVTAMEKLIHLSGQLAATNPDVASGGGFKSATVALREALGGQTESIAERFNIPRSTIQSLKDAGLSGVEFAEALVKAAHGSEALVTTLSNTATGQLSNFHSAMLNIAQVSTKPAFDELTAGLKQANVALAENGDAWGQLGAAAVKNSIAIEKQMLSSTANDISALAKFSAWVKSTAEELGKLDAAQRAAAGGAGHFEPGGGLSGLLGAIAPGVPGAPSSTEDPHADNFRAAQAGLVKTAADSAAAMKAQGTTLNKDLKELQSDTVKHAVKSISEELDATRQAATEKKHAYDDVRDVAVKAADDARDATIRGLETEHQAFQDNNAAQIRGLERQRDAQLQAASDGHQAAVRGIEAEQQAVSRARTTEDRARESNLQSILRGAETELNTRLDNLDREKTAIEQRRDAALRALDAEGRAEDHRHSAALKNIDTELDRKLGIIDKQRDAIDAAAQRDERRQTDQSLNRALSDARKQLKDADTKPERERAQRAVSDAEAAIARERVSRQREDARAALQAQADAARETARIATEAEKAKDQGIKEGLQTAKQGVTDTAKVQLTAVQQRVEDERKGYADEVQAQKDAYALESQNITDRRTNEDADFALRKQGIDDVYASQQRAIDKAFNDPDTGSISLLKQEADAADREYGRQKQAANDTYDAAKLAADTAYKAATKSLDDQTAATEKDLQRQKDLWTAWAEHIDDQIKAAGTNVEKLRGIDFSPPGGTSGDQNAGQGSGEPPSRGQAAALAANIGADTAAGLAAGLSSPEAQEAVKAGTDTLVNTNVIDEANTLLGTKSPSTVFAAIGVDTAQGFVNGYGTVDLAAAIRVPFESARDWLDPYWVGTMTPVGVTANANFVAGYDGPGLSLAMQSPFNDFFDTRTAYIYQGFSTVGETSGKNVASGFDSARVGDAMYSEVRGALIDMTNMYPSFVQLGYNYGVSMANGFQAAVDDWHAMQAEAAGLELGSQVGHAAGGGNIHGMTIVGERGPELLNQTGQVLPADTTQNLLAAASGKGGPVGSGSSTYNFNGNISIDGTGKDSTQIAYEIAPKLIEQMARVLDAAHRDTPVRLDRSFPGAD